MKFVAINDMVSMKIDVYLIKEQGSETKRTFYQNGSMIDTAIVENDYPAIDIVKPFFSLPYRLAEMLLSELSRKGVKPENESELKGLLDATKYHLEDMRALVFEDKKPERIEVRNESSLPEKI